MKIVTETEESIARSIRRLHDYTFRRFIRFPKSMGYAVDTGVDGDLYTIRRNDQQRAKGKGEDRNSFDARLSRLSLIARRARSTKTGGGGGGGRREKYGILILICPRYPRPSKHAKTLSTER